MKKRPRQSDGERCLEAALAYRQLGWSSLALCSPDHAGFDGWHKCASPGKRPWHRWIDSQSKAASKWQIENWWRQHPNSNVGVALGPVSGLVRIDVDGPEAEKALHRLSDGDLPRTLKFTGGRLDSYGLLYSIPEGATLRTTPKPGGIEIGGELRLQAKGAQTVLPPSRHPSGCLYCWSNDCGPDDIDPAFMPHWLVEAMRPEQQPQPTTKRKMSSRPSHGGLICDGQRNSTLASIAGRWRNQGCDEDVIAANLLAVNAARCVPPLDEDEVRSIAHSIARYSPGSVVSEEEEDGIRVVVRRTKRPGHYTLTTTLEV